MQNTMATDFHRYIGIALLPIRENPEQSSQSASHYKDAYFENDVLIHAIVELAAETHPIPKRSEYYHC
jgi:hypothetical protein